MLFVVCRLTIQSSLILHVIKGVGSRVANGVGCAQPCWLGSAFLHLNVFLNELTDK